MIKSNMKIEKSSTKKANNNKNNIRISKLRRRGN